MKNLEAEVERLLFEDNPYMKKLEKKYGAIIGRKALLKSDKVLLSGTTGRKAASYTLTPKEFQI